MIEGPPVKLTLSQPLKPADPSYRELTRDAYARRLAGQGLRDDLVQAPPRRSTARPSSSRAS